ncbi:phenylalanine--tRNA ligase subunit beta [Methylophilaceae bacterium]|nr:phenylalanine--tRNA ligase subunit beta [Methylophilaceae bacterium]
MQVSKLWLQDYFNESIDSVDLEQVLTMAGLEVEDIQNFSDLSDLIVVGEIIGIEKHQDADRLNICQVNVGDKEPLQIVCGAPNARLGIKVPCAMVGAKLPEFDIKKAKLRGVESHGMLCSEKEIGFSEESDGLYELNSDLGVGQTIKNALSLNDTIYVLSLTPNRADCLSIMGVAREISALTQIPLKAKDIDQIESSFKSKQNVVVEDSKACPRYCGREIRGIDNTKKLPAIILSRLASAGVKSISPVVDITNFVLFEIGQPLHAFDSKKISGSIVVRKSKPKESLNLLNDQEIEFTGNELIIADDKQPLALAGIMGGELSSVEHDTSSIFLECAYFDPANIAGRARSFGLNTDSSHRFERGVDFGRTLNALNRASELILKYCGGEGSDIIDIASNLPERQPIAIRTKRVSDILGVDVSAHDVEKILKALHFDVDKNGDDYIVKPPSYRFDIEIEEDLIEEVIRIYGYDSIPAIQPVIESNILSANDKERSTFSIKSSFCDYGYDEVITYSFVDKEVEEKLHENSNSIELQNPIASQMSAMRSKLWGSHLETLTYNINRGQSQVRLFEIASVYKKNKSVFEEKVMLSGLAYGDHLIEQWSEKKRQINYFDIKGDLEGISINSLEFRVPESSNPKALHPGQTSELFHNEISVGWLGRIHPAWQQHYELTSNVYLFEVTLDALIHKKVKKIDIPSKFNPIRRDIAVIIDKKISTGELVKAIKNEAIPRLVDFYPFDLYEGSSIEEGKKSVAFLILMQDTYKTLADQDVNKIVESILVLLKNKFSAKLR